MNNVILKCEKVVKKYDDGALSVQVLNGLDLEVSQGQSVSIIGSSGSGKSTFLRCINGLEEIQGGEVRLDGETISGLKNSALPAVRQKLGMVFQSYDLFPHMNILDNITLAPTKVQKRSRKEAEAEARELLSRVNLADKEKAYPRMLSGGQKQRVAIVRALAMHPELMLFDEVTAALDPEMVREVLDVIMELSEQGLTMLIVTHEMSFARAVADRIVFMDGGHIVETGTPEEFFTAPKTERARTFLDNFQFIAKSRKEEKSA